MCYIQKKKKKKNRLWHNELLLNKLTVSRSQKGFPVEGVVIAHWMLFFFFFLLFFPSKIWTGKVSMLKAE